MRCLYDPPVDRAYLSDINVSVSGPVIEMKSWIVVLFRRIWFCTWSQGIFPGDVDEKKCKYRIHSRNNEPYIHIEVFKLTSPGEMFEGGVHSLETLLTVNLSRTPCVSTHKIAESRQLFRNPTWVFIHQIQTKNWSMEIF